MLRLRARARQAASAFAGWCVKRKKFEQAVVTTPFMSMLSLIASRKRLSFVSAGNCLINARSPGRCLVKSGTAEQPPNQVMRRIAGKIVRIIVKVKSAAPKNWLNNLDIIRNKNGHLAHPQRNRVGPC